MSKYLDLAINVARDNPIEKLPRMAAVLLTRDKQLFVGLNRYKTHPLQKEFGKNSASIYLHAEIDALVQANRNKANTDNASMFVARIGRAGYPMLAKPCPGCKRALIHFCISNVTWTDLL